MKKLIICVLMLIGIKQLNAQDINGSYRGSLAVGTTKLQVIFNVERAADGSYSATFDSPDQKAFGIKCTKTTVVKDSLFLEVAQAGILYKGVSDGKGAITGVFKQGASSLPLNLQLMRRPQTPKPPFNYFTEDVEYDNADKSLHYGATFTRPNGKGKFPAVIIITGSGTQDRDGTLFGHKLYWVLADYLTKNGIAVLRVDDRGAGKSTIGSAGKNVTSVDFSYDVETSLNYLETRADVDKKHIGLIGHSEGGVIAPMVAARRKDVSFIVMWGGPEVGGAVINTQQNVYSLKQAGVDSVAVNAFRQLHLSILKRFATSPNVDSLDKQVTVLSEKWEKLQTEKTLSELRDKNFDVKDLRKLYNSLYNIPWMRFFIAYEPEKDLGEVKCPVLAINGEKDSQVDAASNLSLIKQILTKNGNKDFEIKAMPGLNHLMQTAQTGDLSEYETIEETMSPAAMKIISDWIKIHVK